MHTDILQYHRSLNQNDQNWADDSFVIGLILYKIAIFIAIVY